jgi:hypothetical protein
MRRAAATLLCEGWCGEGWCGEGWCGEGWRGEGWRGLTIPSLARAITAISNGSWSGRAVKRSGTCSGQKNPAVASPTKRTGVLIGRNISGFSDHCEVLHSFNLPAGQFFLLRCSRSAKEEDHDVTSDCNESDTSQPEFKARLDDHGGQKRSNFVAY